MGYEEGFTSADKPSERRGLFSGLRRKEKPVQRQEGFEGPDAFLANLRLQVTCLQAIELDLKRLNSNLEYVGAALDGLRLELRKAKVVKE